jgi:hypothetical protein
MRGSSVNSDLRHQVFVSSTFRDLIEERRHVMQALLELDCMPAGMELFPASDDDAWTLIKQVIDESDYYIVIVGGKYGSVHSETGISYTRMEYEYAISQSKPVLGFLHADPDTLPVARSEVSQAARDSLATFRALVSRKACRTWTTPEELGGIVSRSVIRLRKSHPMPGWVRADINGDLVLRERIIEFESQLLALRSEKAASSLREVSLGGGEGRVRIEINAGDAIETIETTWNKILLHLTPLTLDPIDQAQMSLRLAAALANDRGNPGDGRSVTTESITRVIVFMLASGVLERRQYEYRITEAGISIAANLQMRSGAEGGL